MQASPRVKSKASPSSSRSTAARLVPIASAHPSCQCQSQTGSRWRCRSCGAWSLALDRARDQGGDDESLQDHEDHDGGQGRQDRGCRQQVGAHRVGRRLEAQDAHPDRVGRIAVEKDEGDQELSPRAKSDVLTLPANASNRTQLGRSRSRGRWETLPVSRQAASRAAVRVSGHFRQAKPRQRATHVRQL